MVDFAVDHHVSSINTHGRDAAIPPPLRPMFEQMLRSLGYRFALREVQPPDFVINGTGIQLKSVWENVGNAPPYAAFRVSYRLRRDDGAIVKQWSNTTSNLATWLPGGLKTDVLNDWAHDDGWQPLATPAGSYKLDLALLWPHANEPAIALAIAGRRSDGWYEVSQLQLVNRRKIQGVTVPVGQSIKGHLVDNDMTSAWHNGGKLVNGWVELELEKEAVINTIAYKDDWPCSLGIAVATTPGVWTTVSHCVAGGSSTEHTDCAFAPVTARYIRLELDYGSTPIDPDNIWMVPTNIQVLERP